MALVLGPETSARLNAGEESILVTGANGWFGRAFAEMLVRALDIHVPRRLVLCGSSRNSLQLQDGSVLPVYALGEGFARLGKRPAYICHFAFLTKDRVGQMPDREYIERNRELADRVLTGAKRHNIRGILLSSSGAVYDHLKSEGRDGAANLYGMLKAEDETRFGRLSEVSGIPLVVPRIFNVSGPFINKLGAYALASIIVDALNGGPIRLRAVQPVYRSYVHVTDILEVSLAGLLDAADRSSFEALTFDTRGNELLEVGELATRVGAVLGREDVPIVRPPLTSDSADYYVGDGRAFRKLLNRQSHALIGLDQQILDTAAFIRQVRGSA